MPPINPEHLEPRLFLAASYAASERAQDATRMIADFDNTRVKQGGVPFVMLELKGRASTRLVKIPYQSVLVQQLSTLDIPYDFYDRKYDVKRLNGPEIETLLFGHRVHGRITQTGQEHGLSISADGIAISLAGRSNASGSVRIERNRFCFVEPATEWCAQILRNPGGTRQKENEYFFFDGWALPFSVVE
jgi:adenylate cyclase